VRTLNCFPPRTTRTLKSTRNGEQDMLKLTTEKRNRGSTLIALLPLMLMTFTTGTAFAQFAPFPIGKR
jgi:hypothetical protein